MNQTKGVQTLLGDPKKAIISLSIPMIIAMSSQSIYNLADAIWVSGIPLIGNQALSAVGFFFPFFLLTMALSVGIGIGGGTAISRKIGEHDQDGVNSVGAHTIIIMLLVAVLLTVLFLLFQKPIFIAMGAQESLESALSYSTIMFSATLFIFFTNIANALLRSEGNVKRAMTAILIGTVLNIVLDPIFIFTQIPGIPFKFGLGLGIAGAAYASVLSMFISSLFLFKWLFIDKNNHVQFHFKGFRFKKKIIQDIVKVGLPSSLSQSAMAIMNVAIIKFLSFLSNDNGVAIFTAGWRIVAFAILPMIGMATAVTSVSGAAYGARSYDKLEVSHAFSIQIGIVIELVLAGLVYWFAPQIVRIFTYTGSTSSLAPDIVIMLRIMCIFFPSVAGGMLSSSMFEGTGQGMKSLTITLLRTITLGVFFAWLLAFPLNMGVTGVYYGIAIGSWISSIFAFIWGRVFIRGLQNSIKTPSA